MPLSIKQKQVLGVTSIVALVVVVLSLLHMTSLARVLLQQSQQRGRSARRLDLSPRERSRDLEGNRVRGAAPRPERAGRRSNRRIYSENVTYAAIVDTDGTGHRAQRSRAHRRAAARRPTISRRLFATTGFAQLRAIYETDRMLEWRQPDASPATSRSPRSASACRRCWCATSSTRGSGRPRITAAVALLAALLVAVLLSNIVLRPIHVIRSGLSRLGRGDLGATLDLEGDEFKDLGDIFASVSNQLKATLPAGAQRSQLLELSRRVASLGRLTAGVAHEVKNPLNAMTIHLELLKAETAGVRGSAAAGEHVDIIGSEIRRLDDVVQGFLKFARPEELTLQPASPSELAADVLKMIEPEAKAARRHAANRVRRRRAAD